MHSTNHKPPSPYQQIRRLLLILSLAVGSALAVTALMIYKAPTERNYMLGDVLVAPDVLAQINLQDAASTWHFDGILISFTDPVTHQPHTNSLPIEKYRELYHALEGDFSLTEEKSNSSQPNNDLVELSIWLSNGSRPQERRLLQTLLFMPKENRYRVKLYQIGQARDPLWATFVHPNLAILLQTLTKTASS